MASAVHTFISYLALSTPAPLEELLLHPFYLQLFGGICLPGEYYRTDNTRYDRILTAPSLSFPSCTWPSIRESFYWNIWHFSELMLNKECCMIERSYRQKEVWQWRICDKKDSLFFLSFSKSRRVEKYHLWKFLPNSVIFNFMIRVNGDEDF